jgi:nucleoside-diphosphate-sugar epimerase
MRVLFTGATGVLGRQAVPRLVAAGHEVVGVTRSEAEAQWLRSVGAAAQTLDLFDGDRVDSTVRGFEVVVHYATAIPPMDRMTKASSWETNDRLRSEATRHLVSAALKHGVGRFMQQSITLPYADGGDAWLDESAAIDPPWKVVESALEAESEAGRFAAGGGAGVVLRLARLYGPSASVGYVAAIKARKLPIVGKGDNWLSSIHEVDAGSAVVAAMGAPGGTYNLGDDEPVTSAEWARSLAEAVGAPAPRRIPRWLARIGAGGASRLLTISQRVSNRAFREATGWAPRYPSVRDGWAEMSDAS